MIGSAQSLATIALAVLSNARSTRNNVVEPPSRDPSRAARNAAPHGDAFTLEVEVVVTKAGVTLTDGAPAVDGEDACALASLCLENSCAPAAQPSDPWTCNVPNYSDFVDDGSDQIT